MADWNMDGRRAAVTVPGVGADRLTRIVRLSGGALSAGLVLWLGFWAYQQALRQINGAPVLIAPEGPARTPPDDPGGELAEHQGLQVNRIASVGEAGESDDLLRLAPAAPDLAPEDTASDQLQISLGTALAPPPRSETSPHTVAPSDAMRATSAPATAPVAPLPDDAAEPIIDTDAAVMEALGMEVAPAGEATAPEELRPRPRPRGDALAGVVADATAASMAPGGVIDLPPESLTPGMALAHIGSFGSEAEAKLEWDKALARFGPLMEGHNRVIQAAESGGRTFYRLRVAGFKDKDEARRFCSALQTGNQCVPATVR